MSGWEKQPQGILEALGALASNADKRDLGNNGMSQISDAVADLLSVPLPPTGSAAGAFQRVGPSATITRVSLEHGTCWSGDRI